jgi:hypothetical protein
MKQRKFVRQDALLGGSVNKYSAHDQLLKRLRKEGTVICSWQSLMPKIGRDKLMGIVALLRDEGLAKIRIGGHACPGNKQLTLEQIQQYGPAFNGSLTDKGIRAVNEYEDNIMERYMNDKNKTNAVAAPMSRDSTSTVASDAPVAGNRIPKAFMSYSWDNEDHKQWTKALAIRLRADGVDVTLDRWSATPGDRLTFFMEQAIGKNDYVLIVCTPNYKVKSNNRKGGVGYEGDIMTGEVHTQGNHRKFIPILREGDWSTAIPSWLQGKYGIDLRGDPYSEESYQDLLTTLHNLREQAPPIGPPPRRGSKPGNAPPRTEPVEAGFQSVKILGVIADEVGEPTNDFHRGCALYSVPFKLSSAPPPEWRKIFIETWNHPPYFTSKHRPDIARVEGDRVILERTSMGEVKQDHRQTLKIVVDKTNRDYEEYVLKQRAAEQAKTEEKQKHRENVRKLAEELDFDS